MSLVWITHDLGLVAGLADRIIVMYAGYIVEEASVFELYANPRHPYTAALLSSLPRVDRSFQDKLNNIKGMPPNLIDEMKSCPFLARCTQSEEKCKQAVPPLVEVSPGHKIACIKGS